MTTVPTIVITGSKKSVYDDEPWIHDLSNFVLQLHEHKKKTVGICFGHQLIAQALGGRTEAADAGWGVGIHENQGCLYYCTFSGLQLLNIIKI